MILYARWLSDGLLHSNDLVFYPTKMIQEEIYRHYHLHNLELLMSHHPKGYIGNRQPLLLLLCGRRLAIIAENNLTIDTIFLLVQY